MHHTRYADISASITKDDSEIRELMHPDRHDVRGPSLAEAIVLEGGFTRLHYHRLSEEVYHITGERGSMDSGDEQIEVIPGDIIVIPAGTPHPIRSLGPGPLKILYVCTPAYSHEDTELLDDGAQT